jgi:predicted aspartyl protease
VLVRVSALGARDAIVLPFMVDTGADITVVPESVALHLRLPVLGQMKAQGFGGDWRTLKVYAAELQVVAYSGSFRVLAGGSEALLGRDVLRHVRIVLDGPSSTLEVARP